MYNFSFAIRDGFIVLHTTQLRNNNRFADKISQIQNEFIIKTRPMLIKF